MRLTLTALLIALTTATVSAAAGETVSLRSVAQRDGYTMQWLGPERSVCLNRDGTTIVIRPGSMLYDVNAHVETADSAPVATGSGDVLISAALARRITSLAAATQSHDSSPGRATTIPIANASGTIIVVARELRGRHALLVEGNAPHDARITLTLLANIAPELPTVLLNRSETQTNADGYFSVVLTLAPDFVPGSLVTLVATGDGLTSGSTHLKLDGTL